MKSLRDVTGSGGVAFGAWSIIPSPFATELLARSGYDWMCVDMQHGQVGSVESLMPLLQVINAHDVPAFVRIPWKTNFTVAMHAVDYGAQGVIVPMVDTAEEAAEIVRALRYPPEGERSWAPVRARLLLDNYSPAIANEHVFCFVMIETRSGLDHVDEILSVPGVDGAYIGPNDLSVSHGGPPLPTSKNPLLCDLADRVLDACKRSGRVAGFHTDGPEEALYWSGRGFQVVNVSSDAGLIAAGSAANVADIVAGRGQRA
ncbi:MAG: aldolase/citrate lyase family protein [Acidimicrobiales bacterium]